MPYVRKRRAVGTRRRRPARRLTGRKRRVSKKLPIAKRTKRVKRSRNAKGSGEGVQWTRSYMKTGSKKRGYELVKSIAYANAELITLRKRLVKNFDDNGYVFMNRRAGAPGETIYPVFAIALNDNSYGQAGSWPCRQMYVDDATGRLGWFGVPNLAASGVALSHSDLEKGQSTPSDKLLWRNSSIKMNLWGARQKPVRWTVQIVRAIDHRVSPFVPGVLAGVSSFQMNTEAQQCWEEMIKQYLFNPISSLNWHNGKHLKFLKTFDMTIQPVDTTDGDQDPKVHQLTWNTNWDRMLHYTDVMTDGATFNNAKTNFEGVVEVNDNLDNFSVYPKNNQTVFLLVRASCFSPSAEFDNDLHGSFDFDVHTNFTVAR